MIGKCSNCGYPENDDVTCHRCEVGHSCKHSIYDPAGVTQSCALPLGHSGPHSRVP